MTDLYICFSNIDRKQVFPVIDRLESEGFSCCVPVRDFDFLDDWKQCVTDAVYTSTLILYFDSGAAQKSPRLQNELAVIQESGYLKLDFDAAAADPEDVLQTVRERFSDAKAVKSNALRPIPYHGDLPYIFVSYAHRNMDRVLPVIRLLQEKGYRVWYDEGIDPGTEWADNIAVHLEKSSALFACLTQAYLESTNCRDELFYARSIGMNILLIYLEKVELEKGMALRSGECTMLFEGQSGEDEALLQTVNAMQELRICREGIN